MDFSSLSIDESDKSSFCARKFKVKPEFHYGDKDFQVIVPDDFPKNEEIMFEIELIDFFPVKVISYSDLVCDLEIKSLCFSNILLSKKEKISYLPFLVALCTAQGSRC